MTSLIVAIFAASLLGSLHCAGMCGAFIAVAVSDKGNVRRHVSLQAAYHGGRLISYVTLGIAAGIAGKLLNLGGALAGIRSAAAIVAGATVILFATITLLRQKGVTVRLARTPAWLTKIAQPIYRMAMDRPPIIRALIIGLCTTLLPCGWLYAFVVTAAGTASPASAAITMFVFWLGTLPILVTMGAGARSILGPLQRRVPVATAIVLLAAGLYTIAGRARLDPVALGARVNAQTSQIPVPGSAACCVTHDNRK